MTAEQDPLQHTTDFVLDLVGNLTKMTDRNGRATTYDYDHLYRQTQEQWFSRHLGVPAAHGQAIQPAVGTIGYSYDLAGRMLTSQDPNHHYSFDQYDDANRLKVVTMQVGDLNWAVTFDMQYDQASNRTKLATSFAAADSSTIVADFVNRSYFDELNRLYYLSQESQAGGNALTPKYVSTVHNLAGQQTEIKRYVGLAAISTTVATTNYDYDRTGRLDEIQHYRGSDTVAAGAPINGYDYGYDQANRLTRMQVTSPLYQGESVSDYHYNDRDELTGADYLQQPDESYHYDANGNRLRKNSSTDNYQIGADNRLLEDADYTFVYDNEGNRIKRHSKDGSGAWTLYTWDHRNRLARVTDFGSAGTANRLQHVDYGYDSMNQLVTRQVTDATGAVATRYFVYDNGQIVLQFDGDSGASSQLSHRYLWGAHVDQILADESITAAGVTDAPTGESTSSARMLPGTVSWPLTDHLGTVRDIVEFTPGGNTVSIAHRQYDSFGNLISELNRADLTGDGQIDAADLDRLYALLDAEVGPADPDTEALIAEFTALVDTALVDTALIAGGGSADGQAARASNPQHLFGYTGRMFDIAIGLQYNLNRWYDPTVGRWISKDPIGFAAGDANLYRYEFNEATSRTDPTGLGGGTEQALENTGSMQAIHRGEAEINANPLNLLNPMSEGFIPTLIFNSMWLGFIDSSKVVQAASQEARDELKEVAEESDSLIAKCAATGGVGLTYAGEFCATEALDTTNPVNHAFSYACDVNRLAKKIAPRSVIGNRADLHIQLREGGFDYHGTTKGGYVQYRHPDGERVWIRPDGQVVRQGPKVKPSDGGKPYRPRVDADGNRIDTHNPNEFVDPLPGSGGGQ